MPRAARVCSKIGCPEVVVGGAWCPAHKRPAWENSTRNQRNPPGWTKTRAFVLRRDRNTCTYCGGKATEVDHVVPVSRGGSSRLGNLVAACHDCNAKRNIEQRQKP